MLLNWKNSSFGVIQRLYYVHGSVKELLPEPILSRQLRTAFRVEKLDRMHLWPDSPYLSVFMTLYNVNMHACMGNIHEMCIVDFTQVFIFKLKRVDGMIVTISSIWCRRLRRRFMLCCGFCQIGYKSVSWINTFWPHCCCRYIQHMTELSVTKMCENTLTEKNDWPLLGEVKKLKSFIAFSCFL